MNKLQFQAHRVCEISQNQLMIAIQLTLTLLKRILKMTYYKSEILRYFPLYILVALIN